MFRVRTFVVLLLIALLVGSALLFWRYFRDSSGRAVQRKAQSVAEAQRALVKFGTVGSVEGKDPAELTDMPSGAYSLLEAEKHTIRELLRVVINSEAPNSSSEQLFRSASDALSKAGVRLDSQQHAEDTTSQMFGRVTLQLERVLGHKDLIAAKVGVSIPCGTDGALYLYQQTAAGWEPALSYEAEPYKEVNGAFGGLDFAVSPVKDGSFYVLAASYTPWCTSTWQGIRYAILRPKPGSDRPQVLVNATDSIYLGVDQLWKLRADADVAQINWTSSSMDAGILMREHVSRYKVSQGSASRIPPVALYPEDFIDEWAQRPWAEAKDWTAPEALEDAQAIHKWLHDSKFSISTEFLQPCPIPEHWQIGLTVEGDNEHRPPQPHLYVDVSSDGDNFRLDRIAADRAPGCPGTELLPQRPR